MKRSAQVALLLMGVGSVGAATYAVSPPRNNCVPQDSARPSAVAPNPVGAPAAEPCPPRRQGIASSRSSYNSYSSYSRTGSSSSNWSIFGRGTATSTVPRSSRTGSGSRGTTSRGGFGGTGHAISSGG